jgi:hypothetical protein
MFGKKARVQDNESRASRAHVRILPYSNKVSVKNLNGLWDGLGDLSTGFSYSQVQSNYEGKLVERFLATRSQNPEIDPDPELFEQHVLERSVLYMRCMLLLIDVSQSLGRPTAELTIPFYDQEEKIVLAGLDLTVAALNQLNYHPRITSGIMQHSKTEAIKHLNPPQFQQIVVGLTEII